MPNDWNSLPGFYRGLIGESHWDSLEGMVVFTTRLQDKNLEGLYYFTSHASLCVTRYPTYEEWSKHPFVSIISNLKDRIILEFHEETGQDEDPVHGTTFYSQEERISCPLETSFIHFDKMIKKLKER